MTLLDKTLSALGLMRVKAAKDWEAKFKLAVQDLAQQAVEIDEWKQIANDLGAIVEATKDDAERWRNKLARDAERRRRKRGDA
ncbi:hypothetical protein [Sphingopyxis flava]|uniref:Uncharacterized protein n=1 Tax=Sphingopyxis flava TaxID=1507287 RepID=A0A1T4ZW35_9SPHN|nr:hypothetical protein [Sphingopyxis flava]SKB26835.1 hypothetical protein SAMN06295937_1001241 [Sphingopyxis flava]